MSATNNSKKDYSSFDKLSTEELEAILYKDSLSSENSDSDVEAVLYITSLLVDREHKNPSGKAMDVDSAWKSFNENYRPYASDKSLYDFDDEDCETKVSSFEAAANSNAVDITKKRTKHWASLLKVGIAAAAVIVVFLTSSLIAYASGYDLWGAIASWTKETFGFSSEPITDIPITPHTIPEQLKDMADAMSDYGLSSEYLPSHLPEDYVFMDFATNSNPSQHIFMTRLSNSTGDVIPLSYTVFTDVNGQSSTGAWEHQKTHTNPEIRDSNGITFYIMENNGKFLCSWCIDNMEGLISCVSSKEDLFDIIDSIKGVQK